MNIILLKKYPFAFVFLFFLLSSIFLPFFLVDPIEISELPRLSPPSLQAFFGTDQYGMDVFSRVINGARIDLFAGITSALFAAIIGTPIGAYASYKGGLLDNILLRIAESFQSFPILILAMGIIASIGTSVLNMVLVIAIVNVPVYIKLIRSSVIPLKDAEFVLASKCSGSSDFKILFKHVMPNVYIVVFAQISINCAWAIQILAALSFVGLGVQLPTPEWGSMIRGGVDYLLFGHWWLSVFPGLAIFFSVYCLNQIADYLSDNDTLLK